MLLGRIELPTSALPRMRSTTELQQHTISLRSRTRRREAEPSGRGGAIGWGGMVCQAPACPRFGPNLSIDGSGSGLALRRARRQGNAAVTTGKTLTREERLAARLRDNLRRRKEQARALSAAPGDVADTSATPAPESGRPLSKQGPSG